MSDITTVAVAGGDTSIIEVHTDVYQLAVSSGDATVLQSGAAGPAGAPGSGTDNTKLAIANNLTDVANAASAFSNIKQAATTSATGVVQLGTNAEAITGSSTTKVPTLEDLKVREKDYFYAIAAAQSIPNATWTSISWSVPIADTHGILPAGGTDITIPAGYLWDIDFIAVWAAGWGGCRRVRIIDTGILSPWAFNDAPGMNFAGQCVATGTLQAGAATYRMQVYQDSGAAVSTYASGTLAPTLMLERTMQYP